MRSSDGGSLMSHKKETNENVALSHEPATEGNSLVEETAINSGQEDHY